jgi:hypothetical protein
MNQIPKMRGIGAAGAHMVNALADPFLRMISAQTRSAFVEGKPVPNPLPKCGAGFFRIMRYCSRPRRTTMAASFLVRVHSMSRRL